MKFKSFFKKIYDFFLYKSEDDSHEFQPLLSEIEERPMSPLGPTIFWLVIIFIVIAGLWLYLGKVDIVITARGLTIPDGQEKIIKSLDKGIIESIEVKEGDFVEEGNPLIVIKPAPHEPALELNNLKEEELMLMERIAATRYRLSIAKDTEKRLSTVKDILPKAKYDDALQEVSALTHDLNSSMAQLSELRNKKEQLEKRTQIIVAPISGYINKLNVHTIGGVVGQTEQLMTLVPKDAPVKIKATVMNQDIGFIEEKMPVSIKVDTFNFQKYGILNGEVTLVSPNSIIDERQGPVYEVYIKPTTTTLLVEGQEQSIRAGMTTTNEIKIGKRRIIEFFIYPLIKYLDESIKVR